jgi:hypothetical protein
MRVLRTVVRRPGAATTHGSSAVKVRRGSPLRERWSYFHREVRNHFLRAAVAGKRECAKTIGLYTERPSLVNKIVEGVVVQLERKEGINRMDRMNRIKKENQSFFFILFILSILFESPSN